MPELTFETLTFEERVDSIRVHLLRLFYCEIVKKGFSVQNSHTIICDSAPKFQLALSKAFNHLTNKLTGNRAIYIHKYSNIPLIGQPSFGIVDRNSSLIELKPITGCNIDCTFCSVDEGFSSKKIIDYIVEKDYLVQELAQIIAQKRDVQIYINTQGEPTLYADMVPLVNDIASIGVKIISINTNGTLLSKQYIDDLVNVGLTQLNLSLNAISQRKADELAGKSYPLHHVMRMARYAASRLKLIIAPVWLPTVNDEEIPKLIEFAKEINATIGIQNYLPYKRGRNPVKPSSMETFYKQLTDLENHHKIPLITRAEDFDIVAQKTPSPMKKGDIITAQIVAPGRYPTGCLAAFKNRVISVRGALDVGSTAKLRILRSKHNTFLAEIV